MSILAAFFHENASTIFATYQMQFFVSTLNNTLFDGIFGDHSKNSNDLLLANSMRAIHRLKINLKNGNIKLISFHAGKKESQQKMRIAITCGFQSLSYINTISAVAKLMPRPPARVLRRKMNFELSGALNSSICDYSKKEKDYF